LGAGNGATGLKIFDWRVVTLRSEADSKFVEKVVVLVSGRVFWLGCRTCNAR
jgi:hypothetical protein